MFFQGSQTSRPLLSPVDRIERAMQGRQGAGGERVLILAAGVALGSALTYLLVRRTRRLVVDECAEPTAEPERSSWRPVGAKPVLGSRHMLRRLRRRDQKIDSENGVYYNRADAPDWCQGLFSDSSQRCTPPTLALQEQHARKPSLKALAPAPGSVSASTSP